MVYAGGVGEGGMGIICIGPAKLNIDRLTLNLINCHSLTKKNIAKKQRIRLSAVVSPIRSELLKWRSILKGSTLK